MRPNTFRGTTQVSMIEIVARAIQDVKGGLNYDYADFCRDAARAAIKAMMELDSQTIEVGERAAWDEANHMPAVRAIPAAWQAMLTAILEGK